MVILVAIAPERTNHDQVRSKLEQWYWAGIFSEAYSGIYESRAVRDVLEVPLG
ncbi:MAG: hypothetical protein HC895_21395 [Leptolyngbyaceae cyanobacterium SM1_3_5]|nr:hypothetical protein [Leptolyngbyaceae cyanobacterium SM1_3_5]